MSSFFNYVLCGKGIQCHSNHSQKLFELKQKTSHVLYTFLGGIFLVIVVYKLVFNNLGLQIDANNLILIH